MTSRLIFEGPDDQAVVMTLLYNHKHDGDRLDGVFDDKKKTGIEHLLGTLREEIGATDVSKLGVILDADTNLATQWARVTYVLEQYGCVDVPPSPDQSGTIVQTNDGKTVGVWVMPDNQSNGALEDFVASLIDENDALWPKAQTDVDNIPEEDRRFKTTYHSKAQVHTWLAWQEEPGTRMGQTFRKKYLDPEHPRAQAFVDWLKRLLADDGERADAE